MRLQNDALHRHRRDNGGVELEIVLALILRQVHGHVGVLHERVELTSVLRVHRDTDACRDPAVIVHDAHRFQHARQDVAGGGGGCGAVRDAFQQHHELVAAEARRQGATTARLDDAPCDLLEQLVAGVVPE